MSIPREDAILGFAEATHGYKDTWNSVLVEYAVSESYDSPGLLFLRARLRSFGDPQTRSVLEDASVTTKLRSCELSVSDFYDGLLHDFETRADSLKIGEDTVSAEWLDSATWLPARLQPRTAGRGYGLDWPCIVLSCTHGRERVDWDRLDREMEKLGYGSVREAVRHHFGFEMQTERSLEAVAPIYGRLTEVWVEGQTVKFEAELHRLFPLGGLAVSYEIEPPTGSQLPSSHGRIALQEVQPGIEYVDTTLRELSVATESEARRVTAWLTAEGFGQALDVVRRSAPSERTNVLWTVLTSLLSIGGSGRQGDGVGRIHELLVPERGNKRDSVGFEIAVCNLLAGMGFAACLLGQPLNATGVDLIATNPTESDILLISATVANDVHGKCRTLLPQLNAVRDLLPDHEVIPVVTTSVSTADVLAWDREVAANEGIRLIMREDLEEVVSAVENNPSEAARAHFLQMLRPVP